MRIMHLALASSFGMLLTGCSTGSDEGEWSGTAEALENGGMVVRNPATGIWADSAGWRMVEELRIGSVDGPGPMSSVACCR
ncbi:MAG: hypothetical protein ACREM1_01290 [Longimicrobiales bacterium]